MFKSTELLAKADMVVANLFEGCEAAMQEMLTNAKTSVMRLKALLLNVEIHLAKATDISGTIDSANRALNALGLKIPRKVGIRHVATKLLKIKLLTKTKSDADILNLPVMKHQSISAAVRLLLHVCAF
jgi:hypothetical protein